MRHFFKKSSIITFYALLPPSLSAFSCTSQHPGSINRSIPRCAPLLIIMRLEAFGETFALPYRHSVSPAASPGRYQCDGHRGLLASDSVLGDVPASRMGTAKQQVHHIGEI